MPCVHIEDPELNDEFEMDSEPGNQDWQSEARFPPHFTQFATRLMASSDFSMAIPDDADHEKDYLLSFTGAGNDFIHDALIELLLGENNVQRLGEFRRYGAGWDSGVGHPLDKRSEDNLVSFLGGCTKPFPTVPSLFLTRAGNLQLAWEDEEGSEIELEFFPHHVEGFTEESNEEFSVSIGETGRLLC